MKKQYLFLILIAYLTIQNSYAHHTDTYVESDLKISDLKESLSFNKKMLKSPLSKKDIHSLIQMTLQTLAKSVKLNDFSIIKNSKHIDKNFIKKFLSHGFTENFF